MCEARYNEDKFKFNKIKTWTSCLPDEVRERDYEMDLFEVPRNLRKVPSPIKHLLQADAKETDDPPKPTWGSPNAPPIIGAVHRRPREANVSDEPDFAALLSQPCFHPRSAALSRVSRTPRHPILFLPHNRRKTPLPPPLARQGGERVRSAQPSRLPS